MPNHELDAVIAAEELGSEKSEELAIKKAVKNYEQSHSRSDVTEAEVRRFSAGVSGWAEASAPEGTANHDNDRPALARSSLVEQRLRRRSLVEQRLRRFSSLITFMQRSTCDVAVTVEERGKKEQLRAYNEFVYQMQQEA
eukprot:SAG31_NODE_3846_length_3819_cov_9.633871_3_plen_139_part_01